ncbi:MAG: sulfatase-like hydrolase/transferase [Rikenellaceae bacterium]
MKTKLSSITLSLIALTGVAKERPNLLVIFTDEQNFRTIGAYREQLSEDAAEPWGKGTSVDTPNLDFLAHNGALCTSFYSPAPVSSPARSSFVSGFYPGKTHVVGNDILMNPEIETFAATLGKSGYATGYAGKWHLDGDDKPGWAPKRKFGFEDNRYMFNRGHDKVIKEKNGVPEMGVNAQGKNLFASAADEKTFTTDYLGDKTVDFIKANSKKPFCYMVSIPDPHTPNTVRKPYDSKYADQSFAIPASEGRGNLPEWLKKLGKVGNAKKGSLAHDPKGMAAYWGMVKCIDDNVGKILEALKAEGILDNTIIVFNSDHGDMLGEHGKDNKGIPFEGSAKVPFIVYYPDAIKAKTVMSYTMNSVDFTPTILSLMDVKSDIDYHGRDYSNILKTNSIPKGWNNTTISALGSWVMATDGRYKLIRSVTPAGFVEENEPVLFDLKTDPLEMNNIFGGSKTKEIEKTLQKAIDDFYVTNWATSSGRDKKVVWSTSNKSVSK